MKLLDQLYQYRELLKSNVKKDIRGKYKGSFLGVLWSFLNPVLMITVYFIVFSVIIKNTQKNYLLYLTTGLIPWIYFSNSINMGLSALTSNAGIIKKVYFPREILPISIVTSGLVNFIISGIIVIVMIIIYRIPFTVQFAIIPIIVVAQYMMTLGAVLILSVINVYFRDMEYIMGFILNLIFYGTPILYSIDSFAGTVIYKIIMLNPMTHVINGYRYILMGIGNVRALDIAFLTLFSFSVLCIGLYVFNKLEKGIAEEL